MSSESDTRPRKSWSSQSFDFKAFLIGHLAMMVLFLFGGLLSVRFELIIEAGLLVILAVILASHRVSTGWRWPGAGVRELFGALTTLLLTGVFLFSATPIFPPTSPRALPWYLIGVNIGLFNALGALRLLDQPAARTAPDMGADSFWRRAVQGVYSTAFLAIWLGFCAFFYLTGTAVRDGVRSPTGNMTAPFTYKTGIYYITPTHKLAIDDLELAAMIGIPALIVTGIILHFVLRIPIFATKAPR